MNVHLWDCSIPEYYGWSKEIDEWAEKVRAVEHAQRFLVVSESTRRDLVRYYAPHPSLISLTKNRISLEWQPAPPEDVVAFRLSLNLKPSDRYFVLLGTRYEYKHTAQLFEAGSELAAELGENNDIVFVTVGSQAKLLDYERQHVHHGLRIVHAGRRCPHELRAALTGALALTYTSGYEGFGLPIAEGMACGTLVITSNTSSMPAVCVLICSSG